MVVGLNRNLYFMGNQMTWSYGFRQSQKIISLIGFIKSDPKMPTFAKILFNKTDIL